MASRSAVGKVSTGIQCIWIGMVHWTRGKNRLGFRLDVERSTVAWKIVVQPCWLVGWDYLEFTTIVGWVDPWWASMVGRFYHKRYIFICWDGPGGRIRQFIYMLRNAQLIHITLYEVSGQTNEVFLTDNSIVFQEDIPRWKCVTCSLLYPNTIHCAHKSVSLLRFIYGHRFNILPELMKKILLQ